MRGSRKRELSIQSRVTERFVSFIARDYSSTIIVISSPDTRRMTVIERYGIHCSRHTSIYRLILLIVSLLEFLFLSF